MEHRMPGLIGRLVQGSDEARWRRALSDPDELPAPELGRMQQEMRATRARMDALAAGARTAMLSRIREDAPKVPDAECDWAARPAPWREEMTPRGVVDPPLPFALPGGVTLHHDATASDLSLRQDRPPAGRCAASFGLVLEVYRFDGSFVSLVHDLPQNALAGLTLGHYIAVRITADRETCSEIYARLNVQHGPNVEQMVRQVDFREDPGIAEFDLAYTTINERRIERAWLDIIIERPSMTRLALWDLVVLRAPRADV